jgi:hypothetical protein
MKGGGEEWINLYSCKYVSKEPCLLLLMCSLKICIKANSMFNRSCNIYTKEKEFTGGGGGGKKREEEKKKFTTKTPHPP